ncbi:MAG: hypothetical protein ACREBJ_08185 [Nitrosotalea sp.]
MPIKVHSLGVELECGITNANFNKLVKEYEKDSHFNHGGDGTIDCGGMTGECHSHEMRYWDTSENKFKKLFDFLKAAYDVYEVQTNSSCGFHMHLVFEDNNNGVAIFSYEKAQEMFFEMYKKKYLNGSKSSTYLGRLDNQYSKAKYKYDDVISQLNGNGSKYYAFNLGAKREHGTIELRLFPHQDTSEEAISSVSWTIESINKVLESFIDYEFNAFELDSERFVEDNLSYKDVKTSIPMNERGILASLKKPMHLKVMKIKLRKSVYPILIEEMVDAINRNYPEIHLE